MPGDIVGGRYPLSYSFGKLLGSSSNSAQGNLGVRCNAEFGVLGSLQDAAAGLTSGTATLVPVPVELGDVFQFVDVFSGATAAATPTHSWAALYNSAGVLLGAQSVDGTSAAIAASARFTFTLGSKYIVQSTDAPGGFLYAAISATAGTVPSLVSGTVPTAVQYALYTGAVPFLAANSGSALGATAPATVTLGSATKQATVPVVGLR